MRFDIITLFPDYFTKSLRQSLLGKAMDEGLFDVNIVQLRESATDRHHTVDDTPYGGGGGMVLKIEPLDRCLQSLGYTHMDTETRSDRKQRIILTSAAGSSFKQAAAVRYSLCERITIICGHYLGVDERILHLYDIDEVSIGDFVLTGGEPAAAAIVDAVARLIPKVLGNFESALQDSYMNQILGTPCYTKPDEYLGLSVPQELSSGNHELIKKYRRQRAIDKCLQVRPDMLESADLTDDDHEYISRQSAATK
ncbi:MAG: tRNA (guanosine(37)-N1)-methyltransferase TrmD [Candidatus Zixiibacteriota bacterium]